MVKRIKTTVKRFLLRPLKSLYWGFYGPILRNPGITSQKGKILFVCKGNICRSPFAEHYAKNTFQGDWGYEAESVGLEVDKSSPSPSEAVVVAREFGVSLDEHKSKRLERDMFASFDLIFTMEARHFKFLRKKYPEFRKKIFLLPLFDSEPAAGFGSYSRYNIEDPYGQGQQAFRLCFLKISRCIKLLIKEHLTQ
jgi:low molecular weight protein-tyrosine phosphatase